MHLLKIPFKSHFLGKENAIGLLSWYFSDKFHRVLYRKNLSQLHKERYSEIFLYWKRKQQKQVLLNRAELGAGHLLRIHFATEFIKSFP